MAEEAAGWPGCCGSSAPLAGCLRGLGGRRGWLCCLTALGQGAGAGAIPVHGVGAGERGGARTGQPGHTG